MMSRIWWVAYKRFSHFVNSHYWKAPKCLFITTYLTLFHQLSQHAFPGRRRWNFPEVCCTWIVLSAMITLANGMWEYMTYFVDMAMRFYQKGEPYQGTFFKFTFELPIVNPDFFRLCGSILVASIPYWATYIIFKRQRTFRVTWLDIRRRYRNEIGSARYYLTRPLTPEYEPIKKKLKKCQSETTMRRTVKRLPKMPRSA